MMHRWKLTTLCLLPAVCLAGCQEEKPTSLQSSPCRRSCVSARPGPLAPAPVIETGTEPGVFCTDPQEGHHVVYVVDRSGSMVDMFDAVRREIVTSFGHLTSRQDFHIIFYSQGSPAENPPQRLVLASDDNKLYAWKFVESVRACGQGDPVPALQRAFDVLATADSARPGKIIHLISDGQFPDNQALLDAIRQRNGDQNVSVHTYLCGSSPSVSVAVMKRIAEETGGQYRYVTAD